MRWLVRVEPISKWGSRRVFAEVRLVSANPLHFFLQISEEIFFLRLAKRAQLRNFWDICTKKAPAVESCSMKEAERKRLLVQRCDCCGALVYLLTHIYHSMFLEYYLPYDQQLLAPGEGLGIFGSNPGWVILGLSLCLASHLWHSAQLRGLSTRVHPLSGEVFHRQNSP